MKRVTGIGGIFFKADDPDALGAWYRRHLGFDVQPWGGAPFLWNKRDRKQEPGYTVWAPFAADTRYFEPSAKNWMINLRVADLDRVLAELRAEGVTVLERRDDTEQGRFGYIVDPEGTLVELWQPAADDPALAQL
jgi:catechol 2,3-dioxygenase-like lactoylglutathione lyase family enzyme